MALKLRTINAIWCIATVLQITCDNVRAIESAAVEDSTEATPTTGSNAEKNNAPTSVSSPDRNNKTSSSTPEPDDKSVTSSTVPKPDDKSVTSSTVPKPDDSDFVKALPEPPVCGVSMGKFSRVVGGSDANLGDYPWIGLAYRDEAVFRFKCGASLITSHHALTAAHCIYGFEKSLNFVRLGELDLTDHNKTRPVDALVKTMIIHENYSSIHLTDDIGILVFQRHVLFTDLIRPICLPLTEELRTKDFVDHRPFIAGWGRTKYRGQMATHLQSIQLPIVSLESCRAAYAGSVLDDFPFDERIICAGGQGGRDGCNGDSGGPMMQPIWNSTDYTTWFYQLGVVSLGMRCGTAGFPGVYTRVAHFVPWIRGHVTGERE